MSRRPKFSPTSSKTKYAGANNRPSLRNLRLQCRHSGWFDWRGSGSLMTPLLILLFGVHPTTAVGTDLLFAASTKATGTVVHATARTIDWLLVGRLAMGSIPASIVTLLLLSWFDLKSAMAQHTITIALGALLLATAVFLLAGRRIREHYVEHLNVLDQRTRSFSTVVLGLVMGALVTLTSLGAGAIGVMVLLLLHPKMPASRVVGSDIAHAVPLMLLAGAGHWYIGSIDWGRLNPLFQGVREESRSGCSREQCRSRVRFFKSDDLSARSQQGGLYIPTRRERKTNRRRLNRTCGEVAPRGTACCGRSFRSMSRPVFDASAST